MLSHTRVMVICVCSDLKHAPTSNFMVLNGIFHIFSNLNNALCKQTVKILKRHRMCGDWSGSALFAYVP